MIILTTIEVENNSSSFLGLGWQLLSIILVFAFVLLLAYYSTRFVAGAKIKNMKKTNMKVVETISLGLNHIHIIKVGKQHFIISQSKEGIRMLSEIDGEELIINDEIELPSFKKYLKKQMNNVKSNTKKGDKYEK